jgi:hypothetical protein
MFTVSSGAEDHLKEIIQDIIFSFALEVLRHSKNIFLLTGVCRLMKTISSNFFKADEHKL